MPHLTLREPISVVQVEIERQFGSARSDLGIDLVDVAGTQHLAFETKVNDPVSEKQLDAYVRDDHIAVLYLPGLTGLLMSATEIKGGDRRLTGAALVAALADYRPALPSFIASYVDAVEHEAARIAMARRAARGDIDFETVPAGRSPAQALQAVAWVAEVHQCLRDIAPRHGLDAASTARIQRNDYGIYWHGCTTPLKAPTAQGNVLYIDVLASLHTGARSVAIKTGFTPGPGLAAAYEFVQHAGRPSSQWVLSRGRLSGQSATVLKLRIAPQERPDVVAQATVEAGSWIRAIASGSG